MVDVLANPAVVFLDSPDDPRLDPYRNLRTQEHPLGDAAPFVGESERVVARLLAQKSLRPHSIVVTEGKLRRLTPMIPAGTDIYVLSQASMNSLVGFPIHRGCLGMFEQPSRVSAADIVTPQSLSTTVIAEGIADPANLGSIIRNSFAFGATCVVCDPAGANPFSRRAVRTSLGHVGSLPVTIEDPAITVRSLRQRVGDSLTVIAGSVSTQAEDIRQVRRGPHTVLCVGNEGLGLSDKLRASADIEAMIPMAPESDSVNVAAATAVLLHELRIL